MVFLLAPCLFSSYLGSLSLRHILSYFWTPFIDNAKLVESELTLLASFCFLCRVKATCYCNTMNYRGGRSLPRLFLLPGLVLKGYRTGPSITAFFFFFGRRPSALAENGVPQSYSSLFICISKSHFPKCSKTPFAYEWVGGWPSYTSLNTLILCLNKFRICHLNTRQ